MQTFLPYSSFVLSASCLDYKRLGKQRVEARQILNILLGLARPSKNGKVAWINHPAVKMWRGYEVALGWYLDAIIDEWVYRGYKNSMRKAEVYGQLMFPPWLGDQKFHSSHRSNLLRKNREFYSKYGWTEAPDIPYFWPV